MPTTNVLRNTPAKKKKVPLDVAGYFISCRIKYHRDKMTGMNNKPKFVVLDMDSYNHLRMYLLRLSSNPYDEDEDRRYYPETIWDLQIVLLPRSYKTPVIEVIRTPIQEVYYPCK